MANTKQNQSDDFLGIVDQIIFLKEREMVYSIFYSRIFFIKPSNKQSSHSDQKDQVIIMNIFH